MPVSWSTLVSGKTSTAIFDELMSSLKGIGFPTDDWAEGSVVRTVLKVALSPALSGLWGAVSSVSQGGFLRLAQALAEADMAEWEANSDGSWLALLARQKYLVEPHPAAFAEGLIQFVNNGAVNYTITGGQFTASTDSGLKYRNTNTLPLTLAPGATIWVPFRSESPGPDYNVAAGTIKTLNVSLPGVTVSNQPKPPSLTWITVYGARKESPKELADRCAARWGRLNKLQTHPRDGYVSFARDVSPQVKRVAVWSNYYQGIARPGCATIYLAGDSGAVAAGVVAAVQAGIAPYRGINEEVIVESVVPYVITLRGKVWIDSGYSSATVQAAVEQAFISLQRDLPIGGTVYAWRIEATFKLAGVLNVALTSLVDVALARNQVPVFDVSALEYGTLV